MTSRTSDTTNQPADRGWTTPGAGLALTCHCWACGPGRPTAGSKLLGPLKLRHCAACVAAKKEAAK